MAQNELNARINLTSNVSSVVSKVVSSLQKLENNLEDLGGVFADLSASQADFAAGTGAAAKAAQQVGAAAAKSETQVKKLAKAFSAEGLSGFQGLKIDSLNKLSSKQIADLTKRLREAGTSLSDFVARGNQVDPNVFSQPFQQALADLNELRAATNQELSITADFSDVAKITAEIEKFRSSALASVTSAKPLDFIQDFDRVRSALNSSKNRVDELNDSMRQLAPAVQAGNKTALVEFVKLQQELKGASAEVEKLEADFRSLKSQFANNPLVQGVNQGLSSAGARPIRFEDIYPTTESKRINDFNSKLEAQAREIIRVRSAQVLLTTSNKVLGTSFGTADKNVVALTSHLPRLRYALYDISNSLAITGAALGAISIGAAKVAIDFDRAFADVRRTVASDLSDPLEGLRQELITVSQTIPVAFKDLAEIATLAGQLNVAEANVANFTESVAKFAATTDVTTEAAATAFGRLDQLVAGVNGQFDNLGSAILKVGVNAVATESDIIAISGQIASIANIAGFSAGELIGFSSALASVGTRPELARGTFTRLFTEIQQSVGEGGDQLDAFARTAGLSSQQFQEAWGSGSGTEVVLSILRGLKDAGTDADRVLAELGITSVRDVPTLLKLAQSVEEVDKQIRIATIGFYEGTELQDQYSILASTVAEKLTVLRNNFEALVATVGDSANGLGVVIDVLNQFLQLVQRLLSNPVGQFIAGLTVTVIALAAGMALLGAAAARIGGAITGFGTALIDGTETVLLARLNMNGLSASFDRAGASAAKATAPINGANTALRGTGAAGAGAAAGVNAASRALTGLKVASGFLLVFGLVDIIYQLGEANQWWGEQIDETTGKLEDQASYLEAVRKDTELYNSATGEAKQNFTTFNAAVDTSNAELTNRGKILAAVRGDQDLLTESTDGQTLSLDRQTFAIGENTRQLIQQKLATELLNKANEQAFDIDKARIAQRNLEIKLRAQEKKTAFGSEKYFPSGPGIELSRGQAEQQGAAAVLQAVTDPTLTAALSQAGFDFTAWSNAVVDGDLAVAASIESKLSPALYKVAQDLEAVPGDAFAAEIEMLRFAAVFGADALSQLNSVGSEVQGALASATFAASLLGEELPTVATESEQAAQELQTFKDNMKEVVDQTYAQVNAQSAQQDAIRGLGEAFAESSGAVVANSQEMQDAIKGIIDAADSPEDAINGLNGLYTAIIQGGYASRDELQLLADQIIATYRTAALAQAQLLRDEAAAIRSKPGYGMRRGGVQMALDAAALERQARQQEELAANAENIAIKTGNAADAAADLATGYESAKNQAGGTADAAKDVADNTEDAVKEVRTLLDYASDLESVISRAFDIRFGASSALDQIASTWQDLAKKVQEAKDNIEELRESQEKLSSDRAIKEYFLSVAESYGDMLRAAQLRSELAEIDRQQAQNAADVATQEQLMSGDLTGTGEAAIQNRADLQGLVSQYQDYITTLAASGASTKELKQATAEARAEFIQQAIELGYQETVVLEYAKAFDDVQTAISKVERNITVKANVNPALQALNELKAKLQQNVDKAKELNNELGAKAKPISGDPNADRKEAIRDRIASLRARLTYADPVERGVIIREINVLQDQLAKLWTGGFTGRGGKYQPAGIVHKGEYVVPKNMVDQSRGVPNAQFLAQMQNANRGYAQGGFVSGGGSDGPMMVELSPYDRKLLENAGNVQLRVNGRVLAETTNASNYNQARRGSN